MAKEPRIWVSVRLGANGLRYIEDQAKAQRVTRAEMIRELLGEGIKVWQKKTGVGA